jgi:acyl-CoA synthetase (AMP-forming)/AMP-acid ligase II
MVGWAPSIVYGGSVGLARRFSASRWLEDVRRYGATYFNYTGKPLSYILDTPSQPDDADNPLRIAFGNEGSPHVVEAFGVPDEQAGDQVMACLVFREGACSEDEALAAWIDAQADLAPKWRPRYVRVTATMPATATNKIVKRTLVHQKFRSDRTGGDTILVRGRGEPVYRPFTVDDELRLEASFSAAGRQRFWDL